MPYMCAVHKTESRTVKTQTGAIVACDQCEKDRAQKTESSKPRKGQQIRYTEKGAGFHYQINGCWPPQMNPVCHGVLGEVIKISGSVAKVRLPFGGTTEFIWRFRDGLNDCFDWDGKPTKQP